MTNRTKYFTNSAKNRITATLPNGDEWTFSVPGGSYVYCDFGNSNQPGTSGRQICHGGRLSGSTIEASPGDGFVSTVKSWMAAYRRNNPEM